MLDPLLWEVVAMPAAGQPPRLPGQGADTGWDWPGPSPQEAAEQAVNEERELALTGDPEPPDELADWLADPDCGPPEGDDAWLAELASPLRDEILDARQADEAELAAAVVEPFPTGWMWHDATGAGGSGFVSGSVLDGLEPGPVLAGALEDTWQAGLGGLTDDELAGVALAWRRCESRAAAGLLAAVCELSRRRERSGDRELITHTAEEVAILLTLTRRSGQYLLDFADCLARLPATAAALAAGRLDRPRAGVLAWETALLTDEVAAAVEQLVIEDAPRLTTTQLTARVRRAVLAADPQAARRRQQQAAQEARVELFDEQSGTAGLAGRDLNVAGALAADQRIDATARALKANGVKARLTQLRAAVFLGLLTGQDPLSFLPPAGDDPASGPATRPGPVRPGSGPGPASAQVQSSPGPAAGPLGLRGSVHLTLPLASWLGLSESPGEIAGFGPAAAGTCRELAGKLTDNPEWCLTLTDPAGHATGHGCAGRPPPAAADPATVAAWLQTLQIMPIQAGTCAHEEEAASYRVPGKLRHLVNIRQRSCANPICSRPADKCDADHTVPFDQGGKTCEHNLGPACRTDHQAKQASGWKLTQPSPGVFAWQLPHGRTYVVTPGIYPA